MARERTTQSKKSARKQSVGRKLGKPSTSFTTAKPKHTTPSRDPWTPWGKWLKRRREQRERKQREREAHRQQRQAARRKRWVRRRLVTTRGLVFLVLLVLACAIAGLVIALLGRPYPWESIAQVRRVLALSDEINTQRARWESLAVDHYEVEIEYTDQDETWCGPATIEVQGGMIVNPPSPDDTHWFPSHRCTELFDYLVIARSFTWLERRVSDYRPAASYLNITFDESFGNPATAEAGLYNPDLRTPECCWRVTWRNFRPLYEE